MPKRFSEADAQRIFAAAAERQHERGQTETGLSVEELEEIGRAAGLDPALVREAAMDSLRPEPVSVTKSVLGMPTAFRRERFIRGEVSDEAWAQIVLDLRRQFNKTGLVTDIGKVREWRSHANDQMQPTTVTLAPERDGTRVVIERSQTQTVIGLSIGTLTNFVMGLIFLVFANVETGEPDLIFPGLIMLAFALIFATGTYFGMRSHGRRQAETFDTALDRIDLAVRDTQPLADASFAAEPLAPEAPAPRLDAALLNREAEADADGPGRRRERA
ncbi:MAG: hypothetical protein AAFQ43_03420 [Bacteroidota bacterium]